MPNHKSAPAQTKMLRHEDSIINAVDFMSISSRAGMGFLLCFVLFQLRRAKLISSDACPLWTITLAKNVQGKNDKNNNNSNATMTFYMRKMTLQQEFIFPAFMFFSHRK